MLVKEKQILETFSKIIPALPESDKSYLLGLGEGMARMTAKRETNERSVQEMEVKMEKRHFTVGEAEDFPETLAFHLEKNSERFTKGKPFAVFKKDHQE